MAKTVIVSDEARTARYRVLPPWLVSVYQRATSVMGPARIARRSARRGEVTVVALGPSDSTSMPAAVRTRHFRELVPAARSGDLHEEAFRLAAGLAARDRHLRHTILPGHDVSLLGIYRQAMGGRLLEILETVEAGKAILATERPETVYFDAGSSLMAAAFAQLLEGTDVSARPYRRLFGVAERYWRGVAANRTRAATAKGSSGGGGKYVPVPDARGTILVAATGSSPIQTGIPIAKMLRGRGFDVPFLNLVSTANYRRAVSAAGLTGLRLADFLTKEGTQRASRAASAVRGRFDAHGIPPVDYQGIDLRALMDRVALAQIREDLAQIAAYLEESLSALKRIRPELVITMNDRAWHGAAFVAVARACGVPTLFVQDGLYADHASQGYFTSDTGAVMGDHLRRGLVRYGVDPNSIVVTGQPRYDRFSDAVRNQPSVREEVRRQLAIDGAKKLVVFATQPTRSAGEYVALLAAIAKAVGGMTDAELIVKLHPREPLEVVQRLAATAGVSGVRLLQTPPMDRLLPACNLLVTKFSTSALEAMMFDKPVITINLGAEPDIFPFPDSGAVLHVSRLEQLADAIRRALWDPATQAALASARAEFVFDQCHHLDGRAAERVADLAVARLARGVWAR